MQIAYAVLFREYRHNFCFMYFWDEFTWNFGCRTDEHDVPTLLSLVRSLHPSVVLKILAMLEDTRAIIGIIYPTLPSYKNNVIYNGLHFISIIWDQKQVYNNPKSRTDKHHNTMKYSRQYGQGVYLNWSKSTITMVILRKDNSRWTSGTVRFT